MRNVKKIASIIMMLVFVVTISIPIFATSIPAKSTTVYYVDSADILSDDTKDTIESINSQLDDIAEIYIVTVSTTEETEISDFAKDLYETWEIGGDTEQKGILFLISLGEGTDEGATYYAIVGAGISTGFENSGLSLILETEVEPFFAVDDYNSSVQNFLSESAITIENNIVVDSDTTDDTIVEDTEQETEKTGFWANVWSFIKTLLTIVLIVLIIAVGMLIFLNFRAENIRNKRKSSRNRQTGGRRIEKEEEVQETPTVVDVDDSFEDFYSDDNVQVDDYEDDR